MTFSAWKTRRSLIRVASWALPACSAVGLLLCCLAHADFARAEATDHIQLGVDSHRIDKDEMRRLAVQVRNAVRKAPKGDGLPIVSLHNVAATGVPTSQVPEQTPSTSSVKSAKKPATESREPKAESARPKTKQPIHQSDRLDRKIGLKRASPAKTSVPQLDLTKDLLDDAAKLSSEELSERQRQKTTSAVTTSGQRGTPKAKGDERLHASPGSAIKGTGKGPGSTTGQAGSRKGSTPGTDPGGPRDQPGGRLAPPVGAPGASVSPGGGGRR